jgi:hypothetical protein
MAAFRLALLLGKTLSELEMTWDEFVYWQAFLKLEPPDQGDNVRTAALLAQITNMAGKSLREGKSVSINDFLGKPKRQSMEDQIAFMKGLGSG